MDNFWPDDLLSGDVGDHRASVEISEVLDVQAQGLRDRTGTLVDAQVRSEVIERVRVWTFSLWPRLHERASYEMFRVRCPNEQYPAVVETYHMPEPFRIQRFDSLDQLNDALKVILRDPQSRRIVQLMAEEASPTAHFSSRQDVTGGEAAEIADTRLIEVDDLVRDSGMTYAELSIFGVKVYATEDALRAVIARPNARNAALQKIGSSFALRLPLLSDELRVTLTESEAKMFRERVSTVLKNPSH